MNKKTLRQKYLHLRNRLKTDEVIEKSKKIMKRLVDISWYKQSKVIMTYIDFKNEVITRDFIHYALDNNKKIIVPVTDVLSKTLILSELKDFDKDLHPSTYGILEPKKECIRKVDDNLLDLILVPGLVFDIAGYRIGYGGGYYDKLLQRLEDKCKTVGLAFDFQIIDSIPTECFDRKVDVIITEERIIGNEH
ncbi:MAG: 5-formyltetrahydrofolate cyclo-ligase [Clostridiales bacterium]|nr:5-formyltetrahydrofolate cyclo-ligase [Clostridiales bacterium]MDK2932224.1 5-formyltetrahydrofolate cyclo-ligase [Clostridiales bacterium]